MNTNRGFAWIPVLVVIVLAAGGWWLYDNSQTPNENPPKEQQAPTTVMGKVYFSITDAAANMGNVSEVSMTVSKVELHNATDGWVTASNIAQTFDLLDLKAKGQSALLAVADVKVGIYDQVRVIVDSAMVTTKDGKSVAAKVPSGEFKTMTDVVVTGGASSSVNMDFLADASLHTTGKGDYIFAPVVKVESKSGATVEVALDGSVTINGGNTDDSSSFGMDVSGEVKENFKLDTKAKLDIDVSGAIKVNGAIVPISAQIDTQATTSAGTGASVEVNAGVKAGVR